MSLLLSLMVWQLASGRARALKLAEDMTSELRESGEQLKGSPAHGAYRQLGNGPRERYADPVGRDRPNLRDRCCFFCSATYETFLNIMHPEDRARVDSAYMESVNERLPFNIEYRLLFRRRENQVRPSEG